jgi:hypothetical protein
MPMVRLSFRGPALLLGLVALLPAACSKDSPAGPAASYVGGWSGTTSQGRMLRFYVDREGIALAALSYEVVGATCTEQTILYASSKDPDDHFSVTGSTMGYQGSYPELSINLTGSFSSSSASGSLTLISTACDGVINGTWTATKASGPAFNAVGAWDGAQSSNRSDYTPITFLLTQSGAGLGGTYNSARGGYGNVSGTVSGKLAQFTLTQTTPNCTGRFEGYAVVVDEPGTTEFFVFAFDGQDCLGSYTKGWGYANRVAGSTAGGR